MRKIEDQNTLVFVCDVRASKHHIKTAVKNLYGVDAVKVNTLVRYRCPLCVHLMFFVTDPMDRRRPTSASRPRLTPWRLLAALASSKDPNKPSTYIVDASIIGA